MRVTVVGYGYWGKNLVRTVGGLPEITQVRVVDVSPEVRNMARAAVAHDGLVTEAVVWPETEALVVASPPLTHVDWVIQAVEREIPVFCEKPCGVSLADCRRIGEPDSLVQVGYVYAYHQAFQWIAEHLTDIGMPQWAHAYRASLGPKVRNDLSVLEDYACHDISLALLWWGMPTEVTAERGIWLQPDIADAVTVHLYWGSGLWVNLYCSWYAPEKERRWLIGGDRRMVIWNDMAIEDLRVAIYESGYTRIDAPSPTFLPFARGITRPLAGSVWEEPLRRELQAFIEACYGRRDVLTDLAHARQVWSVMEEVKHNWR